MNEQTNLPTDRLIDQPNEWGNEQLNEQTNEQKMNFCIELLFIAYLEQGAGSNPSQLSFFFLFKQIWICFGAKGL